METIFEAKGYNDEKSFKVASLKLTKYASSWFDNIKKMREREHKKQIRTQSKVRSLMGRRFPPDSYM